MVWNATNWLSKRICKTGHKVLNFHKHALPWEGKKNWHNPVFPVTSYSLTTASQGLLILSSIGNTALFQIITNVESYLFWILRHFLPPSFKFENLFVSLELFKQLEPTSLSIHLLLFSPLICLDIMSRLILQKGCTCLLPE